MKKARSRHTKTIFIPYESLVLEIKNVKLGKHNDENRLFVIQAGQVVAEMPHGIIVNTNAFLQAVYQRKSILLISNNFQL